MVDVSATNVMNLLETVSCVELVIHSTARPVLMDLLLMEMEVAM